MVSLPPSSSMVLGSNAIGNLTRIDEMLRSLWSHDSDGGTPHSVRACMGNLIVYLEREDDRNDILQIVSDVIQSHPSRVILLFAYPDEPEQPIEVSVSAQCWLEGAGQEQVCAEQIRIRATGKMIQELPGVVIPLLESDVPVHLWWRDRFLEHQDLFLKFADDIDHVIYEGLHWKNLPAKVSKVMELVSRLRGKVAVTNFNWSRLLPWQQRIARFFDPGMYQGDLDYLHRVSIEYHTPPEQSGGRFFQALLLCGWLAGQLGWRLKDGNRKGSQVDFRFVRRDGNPVEVSIDHEIIPSPGTKGIQELRFDFEKQGKKSVFSIDRDPGNQLLFMRVQKEGGCGLPQKVRHVSASPATLLLRGLKYFKSSAVFDRAFANAVELLKLSGE